MRINLIVLLLCFAFIGNLFALDSTSVYAGQKVEHILPEGAQIVKGQIPAKVPDYKVKAELLDNTDTCLINCYIVLNITSDIILIPQDIKASFKDSKGEEKIREYTYEYLVNSQRLKECYEYNTEEVATSVFNNVTQQNETILINQTTREQIFCGFEDYTYWTPGLPLVAPGDSTVIKIKGKKKQYENIDIVPELYGIKFNEWAWWNSTNATMDYWVDDTNTSLWGETNITNSTLGMYWYGNCTKESESNCSDVMDFCACDEDTLGAGWEYNTMANPSASCSGGVLIVDSTSDSEHGLISEIIGESKSLNCSWEMRNPDGGSYMSYVYAIETACTDPDSLSASATCEGWWDSDVNGKVKYYYQSGKSAGLGNVWSGWTSYDYLWGNGWGSAIQTGAELFNKSFTLTGSDGLYGRYYDGSWHYGGTRPTYAGGTRIGINQLSSAPSNYNLEVKDLVCRAYLPTEPTIAYGSIEMGSYEDGQGNTCGYRVEINITGTEDIDEYQVELNYTELGSNANGTLTFYTGSNVTPPTPFSITNYTYTTPQYETINYNYTINYTLGEIYTASNATLEYNNTHNFTATCTNISVNYSCYYNNLPAKLVEYNATPIPLKWVINVQNATINTTQNQTFNVNNYWGIWPTDILSPPIALEAENFNINVSYSNVSEANFSLNTHVSINSSNGYAVCSGGECTINLIAPSVTSAEVHQSKGYLTIYSPFWLSYINRTINITKTETLTALNVTMNEHGTANPNNANDSDWATYATLGDGDYLIFNYTLPLLYNISSWYAKDYAGAVVTRNLIIPTDCWDTEISLKIYRNPADDDGFYYCANYTTGEYIQFYDTNGTLARFYEQNITYTRSNSYTRFYPTGLTDCSLGVHLFNYSCRDEDTQNLLTCNYSQTFTVVSGGGTEYDTFSGEAQTWNICYYPDTFKANISSIEQYEATNYNTRFYYLFDVATGNTSYNQSIFLADDTDSIITFIYVKDAGVNVVGAYIYIQKYFVEEGVFKTVAWATSDTEGKGVTYLVPNDEFYRFVVMQGGEITFTSETMQIGCAGSYCSVTLNIESSYSEFWEMYNTIGSSCNFNNDTKVIACTFAVTDGTQHTFTLDVYKWERGEPILNCTNSTLTASGTLFCDIGDNSTTGMFTYSLSAHSLPNFLQQGEINLNALAEWGDDGIIIALLIIIVLSGAFALMGPEFMALGAYVGIIMSSALELLHLNLIALVGLGVIVGVFIYAFRR